MWRTLWFYAQPKLHKERNPGRLVISTLTCHTSKISEYIDYHLQTIVKQIPSYVNDTSEFLSQLNAKETVPGNSYLVPLDVKFLYTNIP